MLVSLKQVDWGVRVPTRVALRVDVGRRPSRPWDERDV
jgi:hypothetical protein